MADFAGDVKTVPLPQIGADWAESWVQILPSGEFELNDQRGPWLVKDMAAIIERSRADLERGMPVDMDHAMDRRHETEAPAAGWIEELAAREDGIWARIAWTPAGQATITGREYRFLSPVVMVTRAGEVRAVKRAGLTNAPAIAMKVLCLVEDEARGDALPVGRSAAAGRTRRRRSRRDRHAARSAGRGAGYARGRADPQGPRDHRGGGRQEDR